MKTETLDAEIVSDKLVELTQKPIIIYDLVKQKGLEVKEKIASLNLETIEATEDNLSMIKSIRADLNKDFKIYEEQRKLVKDLIMKPYNDFEASYKEHIATIFTETDKKLKEKTDSVENGLLNEKINGLKSYFKEVNTFDFVNFEDLNLHITRSKSDKSIKDEIDEFILSTQKDLSTIETIENSQRVLAKYHIYKDLDRAISETNIELNREKAIAEAKAKEVEREIVQEERVSIQEENNIELLSVKFEVVSTREQIKALKEFMNTSKITYKGIQ